MENNSSKQESQQPKKSFNWRWFAAHLLPIFLVLILGTIITIASVPSFRQSFNKFVAKWSPKADVGQKCRPTTDKNEIISRLTGFTITPDAVKLGDQVTATVNDTRSPVWNKVGGWWAQGLDTIFIATPPFNKYNEYVRSNGTTDGVFGSIIQPSIQSISGPGTISLIGMDGKEFPKSAVVPDNKDIAHNYWFKGVKWKGDDPEKYKPEVEGKNDGRLPMGGYSVTFRPPVASNGAWQALEYNFIDGYFGFCCYWPDWTHAVYAVYVDNVKVDLQPKEKSVYVSESNGTIKGTTSLDIVSTNDNKPFSSTILLKPSSDKMKFSGNGVSGPDKDGWWSVATDFEGKKTIGVEASETGNYTITAKSKDACEESSYTTSIEFVKAKGKINIAKEDYVPDDKNNLVLTIPRNIATATIQTTKVKSDNSEEALSGRKVKVTYPLDGSKISTNKNAAEADWTDGTKGLELTTNDQGTATVYIKSSKIGDGKKAKLDDSDGKFTAESNYGIKFIAPELVAPTLKSKTEIDAKQKENFDSFFSPNDKDQTEPTQGMLIKNKKVAQAKQAIYDLLGLKKAYSEDASSYILNGTKIYPGNKVELTLSFKNNFGIELNNFEVYAELGRYLKVVKKAEGRETFTEEKDANTYLQYWKIDKLVPDQSVDIVFTVELLSKNLPLDNKITVATGARKGEKNEKGQSFTMDVYYFKDTTTISIEKIVRDGKEISGEDIPKDTDDNEKIYPGDKIYYKLKFVNNTGFELKDVDIFSKITLQADDWTCKGVPCNRVYKDGEYIDETLEEIKLRDEKNLIIWHYNNIPMGQEISKTYAVTLKNEIDVENKNIGTWAAIGDKTYSEIYFKNLSDVKWFKRDLWGKITGQISAVDDKPLQGVTVGILTDGYETHVLPSFEKSFKNEKTKGEINSITDKDGNFSLEFDRQKDFGKSTKYKLEVSFYSDQDVLMSIRTATFSNNDVLYFRTQAEDLPKKSNGSQEIRMSYEDTYDFPAWGDETDYMEQVRMGSLIYKNIYHSLDYIESSNGYNLGTDFNELIVNLQPKGKTLSYYDNNANTIYLGSNVWKDTDPATRGNNEELHELGHYILDKKIGLKVTDKISGTDNTPIDVPYISEDYATQCSYATLAMIYNYFTNESKTSTDARILGNSWPTVYNEFYKGNATGFKNMPAYDSNFSDVWKIVDYKSSDDFQDAKNALDYGYPVMITSGLYGDHVFVLTGYSTDDRGVTTFYANNPLVDGEYDLENNKNTQTIDSVSLTEDNLANNSGTYSAGNYYLYINPDYAKKHSLRQRTADISDPDAGYLNDYTSNSLIEGSADLFSVELNSYLVENGFAEANKIWPSQSAYIFTPSDIDPNGGQAYDLRWFAPSFSQYDSNLKDPVQGDENWVVASWLYNLIHGIGPGDVYTYTNQDFRWLRNSKYTYTLGFPNTITINQLIDYLQELAIQPTVQGEKYYSTVLGLYSLLRDGGVGNSSSVNFGPVKLNNLKQLMVLFGFFSDSNSNWRYDPGETVGKAANGAKLSNVEYQTINPKLDKLYISEPPRRLVSSIYETFLKGIPGIGSGDISNSYNVTTYVANPSNKTANLESRTQYRQAPLSIDGSYLKSHFVDKDGKSLSKYTLNIDMKFEKPFEKFNNNYNITVNNGDLSYIRLPDLNYNTTVTISAKDTTDKVTFTGKQYWDTITSGMDFEYIAEKTFNIGGGSTGGGTTIIIPDNNNVGGGGSITTNVTGLDKAKEVTVYLDNKKIAKSPILSGSFGAKLKIPDTTSLGNHEIRIEGDDGSKVTSSIKVTSNKWFNRTNYIISLAVLMILILIYLVYILIKKATRINDSDLAVNNVKPK